MSRTQTLQHVDGEQWEKITWGEYKGTLTEPLSLRYDLGGGNVSMYVGRTADGQECTVYGFADARRQPRYELD
jgi:hypothetical protein